MLLLQVLEDQNRFSLVSALTWFVSFVQYAAEVLLLFALMLFKHSKMGVVFIVLLLPSELAGLGIGALLHPR